MPVPASRKSRSAARTRRAHDSLTQPKLIKCPKCKKPSRPHRVCLFCGSYQGRQIITIKTKKKKERK